LVGLKDADMKQQLLNFSFSIKNAAPKKNDVDIPETWLEAFNQLVTLLKQKKSNKKQIVFLDELPWLATHKSSFMTGFNYFWNSFASKNNIIVIICGSAASWMIKNVINNKGGLHNRVTKSIYLQPFTLGETAEFFRSKHISLDYYQIVQIYMVMGGIPHYLEQIENGKSAVQNIDALCFQNNGFLRHEFENLYKALFRFPDRYEAVIRALATKLKGLTREEIIRIVKLPNGGGVSAILTHLEQSGFISSYRPFKKKKKDMLYRLTDYYSLFYLKFIEGNSAKNKGYWHTLSQTQSWKSWSGYAFESLCIQHVDKIKEALGISGIYTEESSFIYKGNNQKKGTQIDMLIDRNDQCINLCKMKFYNQKISLTAKTAEALKRKKDILVSSTGTKKNIFITHISTYGLLDNKYSIGLIDNDIKIEALF